MTNSMCISATDRPTFYQMVNEQYRHNHEYYRVASAIKEINFNKEEKGNDQKRKRN